MLSVDKLYDSLIYNQPQSTEWHSKCGVVRFRKEGTPKAWAWIPVKLALLSQLNNGIIHTGFSTRREAAAYAKLAMGPILNLDVSGFAKVTEQRFVLHGTHLTIIGKSNDWKLSVCFTEEKEYTKNTIGWLVDSKINQHVFATKRQLVQHLADVIDQNPPSWIQDFQQFKV